VFALAGEGGVGISTRCKTECFRACRSRLGHRRPTETTSRLETKKNQRCRYAIQQRRAQDTKGSQGGHPQTRTQSVDFWGYVSAKKAIRATTPRAKTISRKSPANNPPAEVSCCWASYFRSCAMLDKRFATRLVP